MSLTDRMLDWRDDRHWDDPPTDEAALRQFLYSGIANFIEENFEALEEWIATGEDEVPILSQWVDAYAERPLTEKDGFARLEAVTS